MYNTIVDPIYEARFFLSCFRLVFFLFWGISRKLYSLNVHISILIWHGLLLAWSPYHLIWTELQSSQGSQHKKGILPSFSVSVSCSLLEEAVLTSQKKLACHFKHLIEKPRDEDVPLTWEYLTCKWSVDELWMEISSSALSLVGDFYEDFYCLITPCEKDMEAQITWCQRRIS